MTTHQPSLFEPTYEIVALLYNHILDLNMAIDALAPMIARAIDKITPKSITDDNYADHRFASRMRELLDELTEIQNRAYDNPHCQETLDTSRASGNL
jgi:hypothetical protein